MILNRFIKSWKAVVILLLICVIVFMGLIIDTQVRTQMQVMAENDQLKKDSQMVKSWKECVSKIAVYENNGTEYVKANDVKDCSK